MQINLMLDAAQALTLIHDSMCLASRHSRHMTTTGAGLCISVKDGVRTVCGPLRYHTLSICRSLHHSGVIYSDDMDHAII